MSTEPSVEAGQLSPDGLWRWDGTQWTPVMGVASAMPPPRRSRAWIGWLAGGCAVLLVLGVIGAGFGLFSLVRQFQNGAFNCLPSDFPQYPGTTVSSEKTSVGTIRQCTIVLESNDGVAPVTAFYKQELDTGDWAITSSDPASGEFSFRLRSRSQTFGTISLLGRGLHTEIDIQLNS
jgi:hypothetical protein